MSKENFIQLLEKASQDETLQDKIKEQQTQIWVNLGSDEGFHFTNDDIRELTGPFVLRPGETQSNIPTWYWPAITRVIVTNNTDKYGRISMTAGGSATEYNDVPPGEIGFRRSFGGVLLAIKNEGTVNLTIVIA